VDKRLISKTNTNFDFLFNNFFLLRNFVTITISVNKCLITASMQFRNSSYFCEKLLFPFVFNRSKIFNELFNCLPVLVLWIYSICRNTHFYNL